MRVIKIPSVGGGIVELGEGSLGAQVQKDSAENFSPSNFWTAYRIVLLAYRKNFD